MAALLETWWMIGILFTVLFAFGTGPMVLFYFAWRIHRNIARIADALEVAERSRQAPLPLAQDALPLPEPRDPQRILNSAFGR